MNTPEEISANVKSPVYIMLSLVSSILLAFGAIALTIADKQILSFLGSYEKLVYENGVAILVSGFVLGAINFYMAFIRRPAKET